MELLKHLAVIILNIDLWSATSKLSAEDLALNGIDPNKLPPEQLASLGSIRLLGRDALRDLENLKRKAERLCQASGTRFLGGYAIPRDKATEVVGELEAIKQQFHDKKREFLAGFDAATETWVAKNPPQWAQIIRNAAKSREARAAEILSFNFAAVAVATPEELSDNSGLVEETQGLLGRLYHEVRQSARTTYEQSFVGRREANRKILRPLIQIRDKLSGLCFVAPQEIGEAIGVIDEVLAKLPPSGPIAGADLDMLAGLVGRRLAHIGQVSMTQPLEEQGGEDSPDDQPIDPGAPLPAPSEACFAPLSFDF
ncbi:DUF3150 domain-containing protein [Geoalkalibacter halelectricus]|uniref:DUF3150 domain-containing protein n=1 Tax=Geoalkalibacter halelectricus TaxID=2847045 RepID=A0ABY5ZKG5_9BACT|nr:DUF3150 domain-containing protein [Geoalkalibacter halelectricus]MDO3377145.1 DUF3150 domain-containing protein [Geoalkalibacter halelectricus]UWZ79662.1 DUF3150 domain-containing protein [Geoalkalibacter halelectricus]